MSLVLNETRAWRSQKSYSFKRDRDAKRASSGYAVRAKSAPRCRLPNPGVLQHDQLRAALYLHGDSSYENLKALQTRNSDTALRASVGRVVTRMSLPSEGSPDGSFPDPSIDYHQVFESAADRVSDNLIHFLQVAKNQGVLDKADLNLGVLGGTHVTPISSPPLPVLPAAPSKPIAPQPASMTVDGSPHRIVDSQDYASPSPSLRITSAGSAAFRPIPARATSCPPMRPSCRPLRPEVTILQPLYVARTRSLQSDQPTSPTHLQPSAMQHQPLSSGLSSPHANLSQPQSIQLLTGQPAYPPAYPTSYKPAHLPTHQSAHQSMQLPTHQYAHQPTDPPNHQLTGQANHQPARQAVAKAAQHVNKVEPHLVSPLDNLSATQPALHTAHQPAHRPAAPSPHTATDSTLPLTHTATVLNVRCVADCDASFDICEDDVLDQLEQAGEKPLSGAYNIRNFLRHIKRCRQESLPGFNDHRRELNMLKAESERTPESEWIDVEWELPGIANLHSLWHSMRAMSVQGRRSPRTQWPTFSVMLQLRQPVPLLHQYLSSAPMPQLQLVLLVNSKQLLLLLLSNNRQLPSSNRQLLSNNRQPLSSNRQLLNSNRQLRVQFPTRLKSTRTALNCVPSARLSASLSALCAVDPSAASSALRPSLTTM